MSEIPEAGSAESPSAFVPPAPEALEELLPQYGISQLLACGGMGAVYAGVQLDLDRPVAIKILPPDAAKDRESIERFRTEAKAMARLTHPHIPAVYEFGVFHGFCVLVMELVEGPTIYTLMRQQPLTPAQALEVLFQVCDAVQYAHGRGVVHGDIKPGNILVNQEGMVKLADFGLARLMGGHGDETDEWTPMGTPEYAAPELFDRNAVPDHRADIYSLGVILHELLTGAPPVGEFELPGEALGLDPRVDDLIAKCMELNADQRYQSAVEVRTILRDIIDRRNVPGRAPATTAGKKTFRAPRKAPPTIKKGKSPTRKTMPPGPPAAVAATGAAPAGPRHPGPSAAGGPRTVAGSGGGQVPGRPGAAKSPAAGGHPPGGRRVTVKSRRSRGASEAVKRNLLIGIAVIVICVAVWLAVTRGGKGGVRQPAPADKRPGATESGSAGAGGERIRAEAGEGLV